MKTETYTCNLCGEKRDKIDLVTMVEVPGSGWALFRFGHPQWNCADRHICKECIKLIKEFKP